MDTEHRIFMKTDIKETEAGYELVIDVPGFTER